MAWTSVELAAIEAAIASGELEVKHGNKTVKYRSMADLKAARALILASLKAPQRSFGVLGYKRFS